MTSALKKMTEQEYLQSEETSPVKREYVDGFVYPLHGQAGATSRHGILALNVATALYRPARARGCQVYASDLRVKVLQGRYYYPDVLVTCESLDPKARYAQSPCLIVEVLSDSTRDLDRREKLWAYQSLPSLQGYLLVDTAARAARLYTRSAGGWQEEFWEEGGEIHLPCVDVVLTLDEVYEGT